MPDGLYTKRGWRPFCEREHAGMATPPRRLMMFWSGICLGAALLGLLVSGLVGGRKKKRCAE